MKRLLLFLPVQAAYQLDILVLLFYLLSQAVHIEQGAAQIGKGKAGEHIDITVGVYRFPEAGAPGKSIMQAAATKYSRRIIFNGER